jgi:predicted GIY-YIG superfamily endonuclease
VTLAAAWRIGSRADALAAEVALKRLGRNAKLRLIEDQVPYRGASFASEIVEEAQE